MATVDVELATEILKEIRQEVLTLMNNYSSKCSAVAVNSQDPHTPVIACVQMALLDASMSYLRVCGAIPETALRAIVEVNNQVMQKWVNALVKAPTQKN